MITEKKTHKCKENGRHAAMLERPERVYEDGQDKLKRATVKSYQTTMLTVPIGGGGGFEAVRPKDNARALQV